MRKKAFLQQSRRVDSPDIERVGNQPRAAPPRAWRINLRLLAWSVAVGLVLGPAVYAVHTVQLRRNAGSLFERAQELENEGNLTSAAETLFQYLKFQPEDGSARVMLAQVFDKTAATIGDKQRATEHYYTALSYFADRSDLRTRLAEILLELGRTQEAEQECLRVLFGTAGLPRQELLEEVKRYQDRFEAAKLLGANADAAGALRVLAQALFKSASGRRNGSDRDLLIVAQSALAANPHDIELALLMARVYRERLLDLSPEEGARMADNALADMVSSHPNAGEANLALFLYRREYKLPGADEALAKALEAAPDDYHVILAAADHALSQGQQDVAQSYFERGISLSTADSRAYAALAQLLLRRGKAEEAADVCGKGLKRFGEDNKIVLSLLLLQATIQKGQLADAEKLLKTVRKTEESLAPLRNLAERTQIRDAIAMLEANLAIADKKPLRAVGILQQLAVPRSGERRLTADRQERGKRWRLLAQVYEELCYWELAAKAYEQEAELEDEAYSARVACGLAWRSCGRIDAAVASFRAALAAEDARPEGWVLLARAELERQMRLTVRDWTSVDEALREAERLLGDTPPVVLLRIEVLKAKGDDSTAMADLVQAVESNPKEVLPFAVLFYQRAGQDEKAEECLERLKKLEVSDEASVRLLEIELRHRQKNYDECEQLLEELIAISKASDTYDLRRRLALISLERGGDRSEEPLVALAKDYPDDPWPLERLAELALSKRDYGRLAEHEALLEKLEGKEGAHWRFYRAMRLIAQSEDVTVSGFERAVGLHGELESLRPAWPPTLQLKGRLAERLGNVDEAAEAYKAAIDAGATSVTVFEELVTLLHANNRWSEADAFLARLQQIGHDSRALESFSARVLLRQGEFEQAVRAAKSGTALRPQDPLAHVWLGQTLVLAANKEQDPAQRQGLITEAKDSFETAVSLAPEDFRVWAGLLWYHVRNNDKQAAQRALEGLRSKAKLSEPQRKLAIGQAHQMLGEYALAEENFLRAVQLLPDDTAARQRLAQFYLAYSPEKALPAFRQLLELDPNSKLARRSLAALLVMQGSKSEVAEAVKLLRAGGGEAADRRLEAVLLMQRGGKENLRTARKVLEALIREPVGSDLTDRHLLAVVAEAEGDLAGARQQLEQLAGETKNATYLATLAEFLLRHGKHQDASDAVARLEDMSPNSWQTLRIKTNWLKRMGRPSREIELEVERYQVEAFRTAGNDKQRLAVITRLAGLLQQLDLPQQAQARFQAFLKDRPSDPARRAFAMWLIRDQQVAEAVQLALEGVVDGAPADASIQLLTTVLTFAASHGIRFGEAEARLEKLIRENSRSADLLLEFATLKHVQGNTEEAVGLYRKVIALAPHSAFGRNNLAMLLLEQPNAAQESLVQIEEALRIAGPVPELRDTYALALAHNGKVEEACQVLRGLLAQAPHNPRYLFHFALASRKAGDDTAAADALKLATANNLESELLTPAERRQLAQLSNELETAATAPAGANR